VDDAWVTKPVVKLTLRASEDHQQWVAICDALFGGARGREELTWRNPADEKSGCGRIMETQNHST